jgi:DNA-binding transcriptional ArsR family regulator
MATKAERQKTHDNRFKAMQHPLRRAILLHLIEKGVSSPVEMARDLKDETRNVTYHVKRLTELDCAELVEEEHVRGAVKHYYRATERHLVDTDEWEDLDPALKEGLLVDFMQPTIDDFTASAKAGVLGADGKFHITRSPLTVDRAGFQELLDIHERAFREAFDVEMRSAERRATSGEEGVPVSSSQGCFEVPSF